MTPHLTHHILDTLVVSIASIVTAAPLAILAQSQSPGAYYLEMQMLLIPLIGAILVSGGFIMLNPQPETRRIVIGRSIFSLFFGVLAPQIIGWFHPSLAAIAVRPAALLLIGGIASGVTFVMSKPFVRGMYERAEGEAKAQLDKLQRQLHPIEKDTIITTRERPVSGTLAQLSATEQTTTTTTVETTTMPKQ